MAMKEDNDKMRDHLDFVVKGGDAKQLERRMVDGLFDTAGGSANFQTPHIDNAFDQYSDFQAASAAVKSFDLDATDEQVVLRDILFAEDSFRPSKQVKQPQRNTIGHG